MGLISKYSIGILLTFVLLAATMLYVHPIARMITGMQETMESGFLISRLAIWLVLVIVFLYSIFVEKGSFLLKNERKYSVLFYVKAIVGLYLAYIVGGIFLHTLIKFFLDEGTSSKLIGIVSTLKNNYFLIIFTCLTAGVVEELLMRGYLQPRIEKIYNSPSLGILVSAILFGILHSTYGTIDQVIVPFFIGILFALFYKKYSNIKILIIVHFMIDFISLMAMNFIDIKHLSVF